MTPSLCAHSVCRWWWRASRFAGALGASGGLGEVDGGEGDGEAIEKETQSGGGQVGLETCAEVAADEAARSAGEPECPVRGDVSRGGGGEDRVGGGAGDRGEEGRGEGGGGDDGHG